MKCTFLLVHAILMVVMENGKANTAAPYSKQAIQNLTSSQIIPTPNAVANHESELEMNAEAETDPESESNTESESAPESESNAENESLPVAEIQPTVADILLPPLLIGLAIVTGLLVLSLYTHKCRGSAYVRARGRVKIVPQDSPEVQQLCVSDFFSQEERNVIRSVNTFYNGWWTLLKLSMPCSISIFFCPVSLFLQPYIVDLFWPHLPSQPDVNEAIGCFLAPAGMVYAVTFGFAFQQALGKQHEIRHQLQDTKSHVQQMLALSKRLKLPSSRLKLDLYDVLKSQLVVIILRLQGVRAQMQPSQEMIGNIWSVVDILRHVTARDTLDALLTRRMVKNMSDLISLVEKMELSQINIQTIEWVFLETLGYITFFGVLLLRGQSARFELAICLLTVLSISLLCYIVADLDYPMDGFFRVDLAILLSLLCEVKIAAESTQADVQTTQEPHQVQTTLIGVSEARPSPSQFSARVISP